MKAEGLPVVFRPPKILRLLFTFFGAVCAWAAVWQVWLFVARGEPKRLVGALVVSVPCWLAASVLRKAVVVEEAGLRSTTLFRTRLIPWASVYRLDQTRHSFVVETQAGPVSAGWLARQERERLLRLVLEKARLMASPDRLRWGLIAQYVPRTKPVSFGEFKPRKN